MIDDSPVGTYYGYLPTRGRSVHYHDAEPGVHFILRFRINARYQGRGDGHAGMAAVIAQIKTEPSAPKITISYDARNPAMARLCASVGFQPTGRVIDDEIEACISLT